MVFTCVYSLENLIFELGFLQFFESQIQSLGVPSVVIADYIPTCGKRPAATAKPRTTTKNPEEGTWETFPKLKTSNRRAASTS